MTRCLAGVQAHHVERRGTGDLQALPLADGEMDDAVVAAEHVAVEIDDVAGGRRAGLQPLDHVGVAAGRHEADVLAVVLVGDRKPEAPRMLARLGLGHVAERKAQDVELLMRGAEQEVALVALLFAGAVERAAAGHGPRRDVMAGRQHLRAQFARGAEQVLELDRHVAVDAGHRRLARDVALGEAVDHRLLEAAFVVEHVVRNADPVGHRAGVVDVLAGAAGALAVRRRPVVVKLERDADDVIALGLQKRGRHRRVDAAGHGDDDAGVLRAPFEVETVTHSGSGFRRSCFSGDRSQGHYYRDRLWPSNVGSLKAAARQFLPRARRPCRWPSALDFTKPSEIKR